MAWGSDAPTHLNLTAVYGLRLHAALDDDWMTGVEDRDAQTYEHRTHVLVGLAVVVDIFGRVASSVFLMTFLAGAVVEQGAQQTLASAFELGIARFEFALVDKAKQGIALGKRIVIAEVDGVPS